MSFTSQVYAGSTLPPYLRALLEGSMWGSDLGQGVTLSFSFPSVLDGGAYRSDYYNHEWQSGYALNTNERQAVLGALQAYSNVANITFQARDEASGEIGDLRFAGSSVIDGTGYYAWAYYPGDYDEGGDVWFSNWWRQGNNNPASLVPGTYDFQTILHELGHALGLKHTFEAPFSLAADQDNWFYSVMSYSAAPGTSLLASTPMLYDIAAIQYLYGENHDYHSGDNVYDFNGSLQCIWDGGGRDCVDASSASYAVFIDLRAGAFSSLNGNLAIKDFSIAFHAIIEDAKGGAVSDYLIGNDVGNELEGGDGYDRLFGNGGGDILLGGADIDALFGGEGADVFIGGAGRDRLWLYDHGARDTVKINSALDGGDLLYGFQASGSRHDVVDLDGLFDSMGINVSDRAERLSIEAGKQGVELRFDADHDGKMETLLCTFVHHTSLSDVTIGDHILVGT